MLNKQKRIHNTNPPHIFVHVFTRRVESVPRGRNGRGDGEDWRKGGREKRDEEEEAEEPPKGFSRSFPAVSLSPLLFPSLRTPNAFLSPFLSRSIYGSPSLVNFSPLYVFLKLISLFSNRFLSCPTFLLLQPGTKIINLKRLKSFGLKRKGRRMRSTLRRI